MSKSGDFKDISGKTVDLNAMFSNPDKDESLRITSGFWHRIAALIVDGVIAVAVGATIGVALGDRAYTLGPWGLLLGFFISVTYFGILNSKLGRGQTIGKRLLKIQVVAADGSELPLSKSFLRAILLITPLYIHLYAHSPSLLLLLATIAWISMVYFYIINHQRIINIPTGQTYYDLLLGSYVVYKQPKGRVKTVSFWKGHFLMIALILLFIYSGTWYWQALRLNRNVNDIDALYTQLLETDGVDKVRIADIYTIKNGKESSTLRVGITKRGTPDFDSHAYNQIAELILAGYPQIEKKYLIYVDINYEYNLGFIRWHKVESHSMSPVAWKKRITTGK